MKFYSHSRIFLLLISAIAFPGMVNAQCCSGGSGSPISGGGSQGVLQHYQIEISTSFQHIFTDNFFTGTQRDTTKYFDSFTSSYEYFRFGYGLSDKFSMSLEGGYYFLKKEIGMNANPVTTYQSKGMGDLILFPRYTVFNKLNEKSKTEITAGLGFKIPIGSYNDSTSNIEPFSGTTYYVTKPQSVQLSSGANDFIFQLFLFHGFTKNNFRVFANSYYIRKGWNPIGEKLGDYSSVALFAGKSFFNFLGVNLQVRYEQVKPMQLNQDILLYHYPNYDPEATGYKKIFIAPQIGFTKKNFSVFAMTEIPVYQNVVKTQVGSEYLTTFGLSYKFLTAKNSPENLIEPGSYYCPMHLDVVSLVPGSCPDCGMHLILMK